MLRRLLSLTMLAGLFLAAAEPSAEDISPFVLTIEKIMRDPMWIGTSPNGVRWSEDGGEILFWWNPENAEHDSLYAVSRNGGRPRKLTAQARLRLPSCQGDYNSARTSKVYERDGDLFLLNIREGKVQRLTKTVERESQPIFSSDGDNICYRRGNNLYLLDLTAGDIRQLTDFRQDKAPARDSGPETEQEQWLYDEQLQLFGVLKKQQDRRERSQQATENEKPDRPRRIYLGDSGLSILRLSPGERFVTFRLETRANSGRSTIIPNYVTESGFTETFEARPKVGTPTGSSRFGIYDLERDTVYYLCVDSIPGICDQPQYLKEQAADSNVTGGRSKGHDSEKDGQARPTIIGRPFWSDDGSRAIVVVRSLDNKDRWIMTLEPVTGELSLLDRQHDEAWIGGPGIGGWDRPSALGWLGDNRRIWFQSEESGYSHLYTVDVVSGEKRQLTEGTFEVQNVTLSGDEKSWYFISNQIHPGERHFYRLPLNGGRPVQITSLPGSVRVYLSPDEERLAILHSSSNRPWELFVMDNQPGARAEQITHSLSEDYLSYPWRDPDIVTFIARDSATVHARIYHPKEGTKNGAAVLFVHGAGYMQNVCRRWYWYFREQMFNNFLADRGYTVFDIDYRGSAGYGRDWRTGIYRHMGGKDLCDQVDGVRFLVENYDIDPDRVGIYGGSYGGFIALMAMFTQPDVFAAGAALRAVTDWAHYEHGYTADILNVPFADSLAYVQSSPIYFAEGLQGALLICHGILDANVHFQDVVRLAQRLIELGKDNWELAVYPAEGHTFSEPSSWTDEYQRIFKLFEENLK